MGAPTFDDDGSRAHRPGPVLVVRGAGGRGHRALGVVPGTLCVVTGSPRGARPAPEAGAAWLPAGGAPFEQLDAFENVAVGFRALDPGHRPSAASVVECLVAAGLDPALATRTPARGEPLSAGLGPGDGVRLALARALAAERAVIAVAGVRPEDAEHGPAGAVWAALLRDLQRAARRHRLFIVCLVEAERFDTPFADRIVAWASLAATTGSLLQRSAGWWLPFAALYRAPVAGLSALAFRADDFVDVARPAFALALLRPLWRVAAAAFAVGVALYAALAWLHPAAWSPRDAVTMAGGLPLVLLAPPLSAWLAARMSAQPVADWLAHRHADGEVAALESLGISRVDYLWGAAWTALSVGYVVLALAVGGAMLVGALVVAWGLGAPDALGTITRELYDPVPALAAFRVRAVWLLALYAAGLASTFIARGELGPREPVDAWRVLLAVGAAEGLTYAVSLAVR